MIQIKKILLLEDNLNDADLVGREIKKQWPDIDLVIKNRLVDARKEMLPKNNFDLALFDIKLPDGNGLDLLSELREANIKTPIIILTGTGTEEIATAALKAGANDYIPKKSGFHKIIPEQIAFTVNQIRISSQELHVLYVEHHQSDIDLTTLHLKKHAPYIHLSKVKTGEEALALLPKNNSSSCAYDVILVDYRLPGLNAIELSKIIRQERNLSVAIVIVTGQGTEGVAVDALKIGVDDYIVKRENYLLRLPSVLSSAFRRRELERQQIALKRSETKFRLLADYAADWEYWINPDGEYVYISPACEKTSGYPPEAFEKNKNLLTEIALPEYREMVANHFFDDTEDTHAPIVFKIKTAKGEERWLSHFCQPVYDDNQNYAGKRGVNRNITEQKKAEIELHESRESFKSLFENLGDAVYVTGIGNNHMGQILEVNTAATKQTGYSKSELLKMNVINDLYISGSGNYKAEDWEDKFKKGEIFIASEKKRRKDGTEYWTEVIVTPIEFKGELAGLSINRDITERKKAEEILLKMNKAISNAGEVIFMTDLEGIFTFVNPEFTKMYGYTAEEVIGKVTPRILKSDRLKAKDYKQFWKALLNKQSAAGVQYTNKCKNGKLIDIEASADPILDDSGEIIGFLAIQRDITERKQSEVLLKQRELKYKQLFNDDLTGNFITSVDGRILLCNMALARMLGFNSVDELLKENISSFYSELDSRQQFIELLEEKKKVVEFEREFILRDGRHIHVIQNIIGEFDEKGKLIQVKGYLFDNTERKRAQQIQQVILNISNAGQLADTLEEIMEIIQKELGTLMDAQNFFVALYNDETDRIHLPYFKDEKDNIDDFPAGKTLTGLVIKEGKPLLIDDAKAKELEQLGKIEKVGFDSEIWLGVPLKMKGKVTGAFIVQSYTNPNAYTEKDKEVLEIISHQISISIERKISDENLLRALEAAKESDRIKTAFLANMSHELRTPLNAVIGFSSLIDSESNPDDSADFARLINKGGTSLLEIVDEIFEMTMLDKGEVELKRSNMPLAVFLNDVYQTILHRQINLGYTEVNIEKVINNTDPLAQGFTDFNKLKQVFLSVLGNALKFTPEGSVQFGAYLSNDENKFVFFVKDNGIGIPKEMHESVFERFKIADESLTRSYSGIGAGLYISKKLITLLDGEIWLESTEGEGTTFYFTIPK